jgi:hypothetical protein
VEEEHAAPSTLVRAGPVGAVARGEIDHLSHVLLLSELASLEHMFDDVDQDTAASGCG